MKKNIDKIPNLVKVGFKLPKSDWHSHVIEWVWAKSLGGNLYQLDNIPLYSYGYSILDVVEGIKEKESIFATKNVKASGHSTYRIIFYNSVPKSKHLEYINELLELGCKFESSSVVFGIDVPPEANIEKIYKVLTEKEEQGIWGFEEAHYAHPDKNLIQAVQ